MDPEDGATGSVCVGGGASSASVTPSKLSPREWATMNHGGTPDARRAPIIDPADVPTMQSALAGSQPVCSASASSPPVSQAPPLTPPAPSTRPILTGELPPFLPVSGLARTIEVIKAIANLSVGPMRQTRGTPEPWGTD